MHKEDSEEDAHFEAIVRKTGNSYVITVPREVLKKLGISSNSGLSVHVKKWKK